MATTYPASKQTFTNPTAGSPLNSPSHAQLHDNIQDTVAALEDAVGYTGAFAFVLTTATIGAANGGTGLTTLTAHAVLLGEGTGAVAFATIGTAGRALLDQGAGADPAFTTISGSGATVTLSSAGVLTISAIANASLTNSSVTISGHALSLGGSLSLVAADVGLGNVTNDAQTKAAVVPSTAPGSGQILAGNAGGTAYAPVTVSGSGATITLSSAGVLTISTVANASLANSSLTVNAGTGLIGGGTVALGGAVTLTNPYATFGSWLN